jgi:uncharacterized membrane protein YeaQ/YmgE (transglycosylase-associated protein family)
MDVLLRLLVQLLIALGCAGIATFLLPRRVPGKIFGLVVMGFAGVWLGEWALNFVKSNYGLSVAALEWSFQGGTDFAQHYRLRCHSLRGDRVSLLGPLQPLNDLPLLIFQPLQPFF